MKQLVTKDTANARIARAITVSVDLLFQHARRSGTCPLKYAGESPIKYCDKYGDDCEACHADYKKKLIKRQMAINLFR